MSEYIYDRVLYLSRAYPATHIRNLAALARLRGVQPPSLGTCSVLELGCATGTNLFAMAAQYPNSHFVGIDNSERQIACAENIKRQIPLSNADVRCMDIMEIDSAMGQFDYIIAHGVYSWVPEAVRKKILDICRDCLSPNGIACISYNVLPGWHLFGTIRDILLYHSSRPGDTRDPDKKVRAATEYLDSLLRCMPAENNPHLFQLRKAAEKVIGNESYYLLHEYLAEINEPFHFHEFISVIDEHDLQYIGDATTLGFGITPYHHTVEESLHELSKDMFDFEQNMDFLMNRKFRSSILCRKSVEMLPAFDHKRLDGLYFSSMCKQVRLPADKFGNAVGYQCEDNTYVDPHPLFQQAMRYLNEIYPDAADFRELQTHLKIQDLAGGQAQDLAADFARRLLRGRSAGVLNITADKPRVATKVDVMPKCGRFPRMLSLTRTTREIPTPWHENAGLDDYILRLLPYLDGTRGMQDLVAAMDQELGGETALFGVPDPPPPAGPERTRWLEQNLQRGLEFLRHAGLLVPA